MPRPSRRALSRAATLVAGLLIAAAGVGCASTRQPDSGAVYLIVDNRRPVMVTIYAVRHSSRFRLGSVPGVSRAEFRVRSHMMGSGGELQLAVDPLGDPTRRFTRVIHVSPGETVQLDLVF